MKNRLKNAGYLFTYAWSKCKPLFFTTSAKYIFTAVLPLINIMGLGMVINALVTGIGKREILRLSIIYLGLNLGISIVKTILTLLNNIVIRKVSDVTQLDYMNDCVFINYHYVQDGSILNLRKKWMGAHPAWFLDSEGNLLLYIVQFAGVAYLFTVFSPWFMFIIALTSSVSVILNFSKQKLDFEFQNAQTDDNRRLDYLYRVMSDYKYAKDIRINQADVLIAGKYASILKNQFAKLRVFTNKTLSINLIVTAMTLIQTAAMYAYFSYQVCCAQIGIAEYTVLIGATTLFTSVLLGFFECMGKINKTLDYTDLFREYREKVRENSDIALGKYKNASKIDWTDIEICFSHVSFFYPGNNRVILDNISFTIKQGEKIGLVGLNGSGKTTLVKLLCRIYDPSSGVITLNGIDIRTIQYSEYVSKIGIVLQDFCLFAYSVRENIVFDVENNEECLSEAISKSGLSGKISGLNSVLQTVVYKELDDKGVEFSGGEGQKLALAHAIYKNASFFILDEPTSTLDPIAEYELFSNLSDISCGKTTVFISHRLSSTRFCDRVFVLSDGHIAECGSHDKLMKKSGIYANLFNAQAKFYAKEGAEA